MADVIYAGKKETGTEPVSCLLRLEFQAELTGKSSAAGLVVDFPERARIDIQTGVCRSRMVKDVVGVHANAQALGFGNLDAFLQVRIEIPSSRAV